ncbi:MAG: VOC family protein, partial [Chloroflexi bacterium]|nr:VOC family protein [Chloroflexota bacterium]
MAILDFQNDAVAGERGKDYSGIHHIGFECEDLEDVEKKLAAHNSSPMDEVNKALGVGMGGPRHANVEIKYTGPNGEMIDVSAHGWVGTRGFD